MFDFFNKLFNGPDANYEANQEFLAYSMEPNGTIQLAQHHLKDSEVPEWAEKVISYNCGWNDKHKGYMLVVTVSKLSETIN